MYVFLDESGNLGFDFTKGGTSRFFVICLLVVPTESDYRTLAKAVERTIKKLYGKGRGKNPMNELKATAIDLAAKRYFFRHAAKANFSIYAMTLNKARVFERLRQEPQRLYNFIARKLLERCPFSTATSRIILSMDRCKGSREIQDFNRYLLVQLQGLLPLNTPIEIYHPHSWERKGLQAVDLFSWGVYRKYEKADTVWYDTFKSRVAFEDVYLP